MKKHKKTWKNIKKTWKNMHRAQKLTTSTQKRDSRARPPLLLPSPLLFLLFLFLLCAQVDQGDQVVPAHQVDDIDEVHQLDPVHQIDHKDEQRSRSLENRPQKTVPGKRPWKTLN